MNALHSMAYIARRKHPLERHTHTHTHTQAWRVKGAHACCGDDAPAAPARTHARTHARTCSTQRPDQGAKEKKKGGKGVTAWGKRKKKGKGARSAAGALAL